MAILKKINGKYTNEDAIYNLVNYILDRSKMPDLIAGGQGIHLNQPFECMDDIRCIFNHTGRQAEHYVLSFTDDEMSRFNPYTARVLGYSLCEFFEGVQVLFAYHQCNDDSNGFDFSTNLHVHFAIGATNVNTGKKYFSDRTEAFRFRAYAEAVLNEMGISNDYLVLRFG